MEKNNLTPLQSSLLEMLKWFDGFCNANGLRYYALGGTMLGAARHKGFIPWDDDIDVGMPRRDYEKLSELFEKTGTGKYVLETPYTDKTDYCFPYSKLFNKETTLVENYRVPFIRGIFIDIFPLDGLADSEEEAKQMFVPIKRGYQFYMTRVVAVRKERKWYKNFATMLSGLIPNVVVNNTTLRKKLDAKASCVDFDSAKWGGNLYGNWGFREVMPRDVYGQPTKYEFEGISIYGVEKYDAYLTRMYGDWRKLPPKEKQVTHHDFISFDLEKGYIR